MPNSTRQTSAARNAAEPPTKGAADASPTRASRAPTRISPAARPFPTLEAVACPTFEDALQAVKSGEARYAMIPIENSVAGRVADIHHLLPDADLYIVGEHFLRVRHQLMAAPGASLDDHQARAEPHAGARPVPPQAAQARPRSRCRRPTRRARRAWSSEAKDPTLAAIASRARRRDLRPRDPRRRHRGRGAQHDALRRARRRARRRRARRRPGHHDLHLPRAQRSGRALQGAGRLRDQRRQHDEARELSARGHLQRHHVLRRHRRPSRRSARCSWRWRSCRSSPARRRCSAPIRRAPTARRRRASRRRADPRAGAAAEGGRR